MDEYIREAEAVLDRLPRFADIGVEAYKPGIDRVRALLDAMGHPHRGLRCVHVGGTNGKGSTASMIASVATSAGLRTGLHTSPHLFHVSERLRVDGRAAPRDWLGQAILKYREDFQRIGASYFEVTVALSVLYFTEMEVDFAVIEVGMGGRLDATNVIAPELAVITDIGLDHVEHLGGTVEEIAQEKAGIIKEGVPVLTGCAPAAARIIRRVAAERRSEYHHVDDETDLEASASDLRGSIISLRTPVRRYRDAFVGLPGGHQIRNARVAIRAAELVLDQIGQDHRPVFEGLRHVRELSGLRGRLEVIRHEPLILADVGHNADGLASSLTYIRELGRPMGRLTVLFGTMRDKDIMTMSSLLAEAGAAVRPVEVSSSRALSAEELQKILQGSGVETGESCTVEEGIRAFLSDASQSDILLITGSHLVVSQLESASV